MTEQRPPRSRSGSPPSGRPHGKPHGQAQGSRQNERKFGDRPKTEHGANEHRSGPPKLSLAPRYTPPQTGGTPVGASTGGGAGAATHPAGQDAGAGVLDAGGGGHSAAEHGPATGGSVGGGGGGGAAHGTVTVGQDRATVQIRDANTGAVRSKEEDLGPAAKPNE